LNPQPPRGALDFTMWTAAAPQGQKGRTESTPAQLECWYIWWLQLRIRIKKSKTKTQKSGKKKSEEKKKPLGQSRVPWTNTSAPDKHECPGQTRVPWTNTSVLDKHECPEQPQVFWTSTSVLDNHECLSLNPTHDSILTHSIPTQKMQRYGNRQCLSIYDNNTNPGQCPSRPMTSNQEGKAKMQAPNRIRLSQNP